MDTYTATEAVPATQRSLSPLARWLPLTGAAYAVLTIVGDLVVDAFPDENTPLAKLTSYYVGHHAQVGNGGRLMELSAIFLALFGVAIVLRLVGTRPLAAAVVGVGTATACLAAAYEGATFQLLGENATDSNLSPQALQAWHVGAAAFGTSVPIVLFVVGLVLAGRALPAWLVWSAVVLAVLQLTPFGFLGGMVMLVWFAAAGVTLALKPAR